METIIDDLRMEMHLVDVQSDFSSYFFEYLIKKKKKTRAKFAVKFATNLVVDEGISCKVLL